MKKTNIFILLLAMFLLTACGQEKEVVVEEPKVIEEVPSYFPQLEERQDNEPIVLMKTNFGDVKIRLFPEYAPKAVENFMTHAKEGYYDGVIFHRVMEDFMIQGGDPKGTGTGGESIYGEPFENEHSKALFHFRGALAMANRGPDTNTSQFYIVQNQNITQKLIDQMGYSEYPEHIIEKYKEGGTPWLDNGYTVFGQVMEGMEIIDTIAVQKVDKEYKPVEDVTILSIEIIEE